MNHFIDVYPGLGEDECNQLITLFESDTLRQNDGGTVSGVDKELKASTDILCNFNSPSFEQYNDIILPVLLRGKDRYVNEHPALSNIPEWKLDSPYRIQRYKDGEGYFAIHCEQTSYRPYRMLAWTLYLNDAECGTYYTEYNATVEARKGNLCIFPTSWTHMHCGVTPNKGIKYIATGWWSYVRME